MVALCVPDSKEENKKTETKKKKKELTYYLWDHSVIRVKRTLLSSIEEHL